MAVEIAAFVERRREWLAACRRLGAHIDGCLSCMCEWLPGCEDGRALRAAADEAWQRYDGGAS